jgi:Caspase domain
MARGLVALGIALGALGVARPATAEVVRYAVLVGEDQGLSGDRPLRFAETDAERVAEVLTDLGDLPAENQVLLRGKGAAAVRRAIITVNDRIRTTRRDGDVTVLMVYYSGHADASALHLSGERLELREIEALVRGSPADVRLLIIDACRSGAITRVKGGHPAPAVRLDEPLLGEGLVFLTSSAAGEDAQESDEIGGSFFTHFLVSGCSAQLTRTAMARWHSRRRSTSPASKRLWRRVGRSRARSTRPFATSCAGEATSP